MKIQRNTIRVCFLAGALLAAFPAFGQNNAVRLASSQSIVTDPNHFIGSNGAVAGFFHHNRKLDFLYGGQDHSASTPNDYWYLATNNGNGTFTTTPAPPAITCPTSRPISMAMAFGTSGARTTSTVEYGDGNGGFSAPYHYPAGSYALTFLMPSQPTSTATAAPIIAVITAGRQLQILLNQGSRVFTLVHTYPLPAVSGTPAVKLLAEDLNGDHKYDLVVIYGGANSSCHAVPRNFRRRIHPGSHGQHWHIRSGHHQCRRPRRQPRWLWRHRRHHRFRRQVHVRNACRLLRCPDPPSPVPARDVSQAGRAHGRDFPAWFSLISAATATSTSPSPEPPGTSVNPQKLRTPLHRQRPGKLLRCRPIQHSQLSPRC